MFGGKILADLLLPFKHQFCKSPTKSLLHLRFSSKRAYVCVRGLIARAETASTKSPAVTAVQQQPADGQLTARGKGLVCDKNEA